MRSEDAHVLTMSDMYACMHDKCILNVQGMFSLYGMGASTYALHIMTVKENMSVYEENASIINSSPIPWPASFTVPHSVLSSLLYRVAVPVLSKTET